MDEEQAVINGDGIFRGFGMMKFFAMIVCIMLAAGALAGELLIAKEALRDGLWDLARKHASEENSDEAKLIILESYAGEGKWDEIKGALTEWKDAQGKGFDYYRAVIAGEHDKAIAILKADGGDEGILEAMMYEADKLDVAGKHDEAKDIWRQTIKGSNTSDRVLAIASSNLMEEDALSRAYAQVGSVKNRRMIGLRLGVVRLANEATRQDGERLIRAIVKDDPDTEGATVAFLSLSDYALKSEEWQVALDVLNEAIEIWPELSKVAEVQESRGWAMSRLGKSDEALSAFKQMEVYAKDGEVRAKAIIKTGDVLTELNRIDEALERYRKVATELGETKYAQDLKKTMVVREQESKGRELYREFRFEEAEKYFQMVAIADEKHKDRMNFYIALCEYGLGNEREADGMVAELIKNGKDTRIHYEAILWLAKLKYNRRAWKESSELFAKYAQSGFGDAAEAMLWEARAMFSGGDYAQAITIVSKLIEKHPETTHKFKALLVQGEALMELARFDEALLIFERVAVSESIVAEDRLKAQILRADALYAMGADNPIRYASALEAYRAIRFGGVISPSEEIVVSFKIARVLDKVERDDEAFDQYYTQVVLAYRNGRERGGRYSDEARAVFSRAAFRLADECESKGKDRQAIAILKLVANSDVPAAIEAEKRINRISMKGRFL